MSETYREQPIGADSARPAPGGPFATLWHWICAGLLRLGGWRMEGDFPAVDKAVLLAAPHTSNWDGIWMLLSAGYFRRKLRWMGKKSLTTGPFGGFVKWAGCVPVDRSSKQDLVAQMVDAFSAAPRMILAIPPEGTRSQTEGWKSGFYHIARGAGVPILITVLDYGKRRVRLAALVWTSGDYEADLPRLRAFYEGAKGRHAEKFSG